MMAVARYRDLNLYRRLIRQARPYWVHIVVLFLVSLLETPIILLTPIPLQVAVDNVLGSTPLPDIYKALFPEALTSSKGSILLLAAGMFVGIEVLTQLQWFASMFLSTYTSERMVLDFRARLFHHAQRLSLAYHDSIGTADSTYRIQYDALAIQTLMVDGIIPFITEGFTLVGMIYVMALLDWQLALVALAV